MNLINRNYGVDILRVVAALGVAIYHFLYKGAVGGKIKEIDVGFMDFSRYLYVGVEIFFVISGFVMARAIFLKPSPRKYVKARFLSIYPTYFLCVNLTLCISIIFENYEINYYQYILNLTFLAEYLKEKWLNGVYWSLFYEVFFYSVIFPFVFLGYGHLIRAVKIWTMVCVILNIAGYYNFYFYGFFLYFALGVLWFNFSSIKRDASSGIAGICLIIMCLLFSMGNANNMIADADLGDELIVGMMIFGSLTVFFGMSVINKFPKIFKTTMAESIYRASYFFYLIHTAFGYFIISAGELNAGKSRVILAIIIYAISICYVYFLEGKLKIFTERLFDCFEKCSARNKVNI